MKFKHHYNIFILLSIFCFSISCASLTSILKKKPKVTVKEVSLHSFNLKRANFLVKTMISNPYPLSLNLVKVETETYIENNLLARAATTRGLKIDAEKSAPNDFLVTVKYKDVGRIVKDYLLREDLICKMKFRFTFKLPDIPGLDSTATIEVTAEHKLPSLRELVKKAAKKKSRKKAKKTLKKFLK